MTASQFVGPYRLLQRVGEGGMGVVHLALDPQSRAVAVKVLRPHIAADDEGRRRMAREVETLRRVRHPQVAAVLDADLECATPYLVTAYVPGVTLDAAVRAEGPMAPDRVAHLGRRLAEALRAVHAAGVVHRDVKPANVMLLDGDPQLIDFGIAHLVDESRMTATGLIMGTPGFLAPEVSDGAPVTAATDWWGWGATLAYAATGRQPFGPGPATAVLDRVRRGQADLAGIEPRLAGVIAAALQVEPARRAPAAVLVNGLDGVGLIQVGPARTEVLTPQPGNGAVKGTVALPSVKGTVALPSVKGTVALPSVKGTAASSENPGLPDPMGDAPTPAPAAALAAVLTTAVVCAALVPGAVLVVSVLVCLLARGVEGAWTDLLHRRYLRGPRPRELGWLAARLPWRTFLALPGTVATLVVPVLSAGITDYVVARLIDSAAPHPRGPVPLAVATLIGWAAAWWGLGGRRLRRGMRLLTVPVLRRPKLAQSGLAVLTLAGVAAVIDLHGGATADLSPFGR